MIWKAWRQETIPVLGIFVALVGLFAARISILALGLFLWGLAYLSSYLARRTLSSISVQTRLSEQHGEIGEAIASEIVVQNPLPWPILDVQWKIDLPQNIDTEGPGTALLAPGGTRQTLTGSLWVGSRQRVRIQYQLTGYTRGRWNIGPGSLTFRDPLSWNELIREDPNVSYLTVWPRRLPLPQHFWSQNPEPGAMRGNPWDPPDPLQVIGIRPYLPGDSIRRIAPYASARMAQLMVKQLDPTAERTVEVLLHPKTTDAHWHGIDRQLLEDTVSLAASVVESAVAHHLVTGLSGTGSIPGHVRGFTLGSERRSEATELLTALAWVQPSGTMDDDLAHVLARLNRRLTRTTTLVIVSPYWSDSFSEALAIKVRRGLSVIMLTLGDVGPSIPSWVQTIWRYTEGEWQHA